MEDGGDRGEEGEEDRGKRIKRRKERKEQLLPPSLTRTQQWHKARSRGTSGPWPPCFFQGENGRWPFEQTNRLTQRPVWAGKGVPVGAPHFSRHCRLLRVSAPSPPSTKGCNGAGGRPYHVPWPCIVQPSAGSSQCLLEPHPPRSRGPRHRPLPCWSLRHCQRPSWPVGTDPYLVLERRGPVVRPASLGLCPPPILPEVGKREGTRELLPVTSLTLGPRSSGPQEGKGMSSRQSVPNGK